MSSSRSDRPFTAARLTLGLASCAVALGGCVLEPAEYRFGENISGLRFELFDEDEGIYPSDVVLANPRNPFRDNPIGDDTKFEILADGGNAGAFYAWATQLARIPTGEHQFYTATKLHDIWASGEVDEADQATVREMAVRAYQTVLDDFPDSVTFDATGTIRFRLATPAFLAILDLGAVPAGDWVLVSTPDGGSTAVNGAGLDTPRPPTPEELEEEDDE